MTPKLQTILDPRFAAQVVQQIRAQHAQWFGIADDTRRIAVEVLPQLEPPKTDNTKLLAALLFGRILTSYEAAYLLCERGSCGDARTIIRAAAESAIVLAALAADPEGTSNLLTVRDVVHKRKLLAAWLEDPQATQRMTPDRRNDFELRLVELRALYPGAKTDPLDVHKLAQSNGMLWLYNTAFRMHSGDAAHTSMLALERHVKADEASEITGLVFGPDAREVPSTLSNAIPALLSATHTAVLIFGLAQRYKPELDETLAAWQELSNSP